MALKIKKGDAVMVLTGKDRGKRSKVVRLLAKEGRVIVEGVNLVKKRQRPRRAGEKGRVLQLATPINISNLSLLCRHCGRGVRHGIKIEGLRKIRICRRCGGDL